jgi:hypothetical protein
VVPPTPAREDAAGADELIAEVASCFGRATVECITVNAVMAGCWPSTCRP